MGRGGERDLTPSGGDSGPQHRDSVSAFSHWLLFPPTPSPTLFPSRLSAGNFLAAPSARMGDMGQAGLPIGVADPTFSSHCFGPTLGTTSTSSYPYRGSPQE